LDGSYQKQLSKLKSMKKQTDRMACKIQYTSMSL